MKHLILALLLASAATPACAQSKAEYYDAGAFEYSGITLPYRQLALNGAGEGDATLAIILHGGTARGTDNQKQLEAAALDSLECYLRNNGTKAYLLAPQCPSDRMWNEAASGNNATTMTECLRAWIDNFTAANAVDKSRIYLFGFSMGGSGAWRMLSDNTSLFAAAAIAAATARMARAQNVKETPVYAIAGAKDEIMEAEEIEQFVNSVANLGGETKLDLLEDADHFETCDYAFTTERLDWVFNHLRNSTDNIADIRTKQLKPAQTYNLSGIPVKENAHGWQIRKDNNNNTSKVFIK